MDILSMLTQQLSDPKALEELGKKAGARPDEARKVAQNALPALLGALKQNAASPDGAKSLNKALEDHKNDNVSDITNFLKNVDTNDGAKMLQHIFGSKNENVQKDLAQKAGVDTSQVSTLLTQLAPLVLGALGNQKKEQGGSDVMNLIGNVFGGFFKK
ncbi:MAG: DUF937 domain-containing protein [Bacillota bacterium]|nr:DUF937 domain-containing protein [Bacillota bacterium]MDW7729570.1 DUF937 domain-containing protein [Bacillota bacterium]